MSEVELRPTHFIDQVKLIEDATVNTDSLRSGCIIKRSWSYYTTLYFNIYTKRFQVKLLTVISQNMSQTPDVMNERL